MDENPPDRIAKLEGLRPSELAVLRRHADRYPIVAGERQEALDTVMHCIRNGKNSRVKLAAVKVLLAMDKLNIQEATAFLNAEQMAMLSKPQAGTTNIQINVNNYTMADLERLVEAGEKIPEDIVRKLSSEDVAALHRKIIGGGK